MTEVRHLLQVQYTPEIELNVAFTWVYAPMCFGAEPHDSEPEYYDLDNIEVKEAWHINGTQLDTNKLHLDTERIAQLILEEVLP